MTPLSESPLFKTKSATPERTDAATELAVDLIYLLEINHIESAIALAALEIVERDCRRKLTQPIQLCADVLPTD
ncbi:MAG: DUF2496 domain-containing protein [Enterobacteriaceae bacterium]